MMFLDPIDEFETSLSVGMANGRNLVHLGFVEALEFSVVRFIRWREQREDLLDLFPELIAWPALQNLRALAGHVELLQPEKGRHVAFLQGDTRVRIQQFGSSKKDWGPNGMFADFQDRFRTTLRDYGMQERYASALAGALQEMVSNAVEHANSPVKPVACFEVGRQFWAFGVVDVGRGALASLRENARFSGVWSETDALLLAVQPGVSRYDIPGRGNGFATVFKALVDRQARLRFRSGGASARWEGKSPTDQDITAHALPLSRSGFHVRVDGPMN